MGTPTKAAPPDQQPPLLVLVEGKQLDGHELGAVAIGRLDIAKKLAAAAGAAGVSVGLLRRMADRL